MSWQASMSWQNAQKRAQILQQIRQFFADRHVIEVETPVLSVGTVTDVHLDAFECRYSFLHQSAEQDADILYLQTSPEFHMKRLLASGYGCIYQIAKAFRHEASGSFHNPEFTMLEWYRLGFDHFALMDEVAALLMSILGCEKPKQYTYQQLFLTELAIDPLTATKEELIAVIKRHDKMSDWLAQEDIDTLLQFTFSELIEDKIGQQQPCFVYNFPASQASLAKICPDDARVAQRFECYFKGIELANGFHELTDATQQISRFNQDNKLRDIIGKPQKNIDQHFINALSAGLPECSGVALGIDRLVMLSLCSKAISEVQCFSIERA
ncbi:elongation factor P--(R)-beta-lysine ligase [Litorilituus sediminis]|uniref:Elongation factor P--(R)-beta-lysine ligase n=1 Tax=Litorilituus sediminis TaxID=718192 RepID=A0A4P6P8Y9_9GAMM|nr:elongation factor P--(R)-beta-lysine ligase [Litorilituus sediminis]QBG35985.1 elongation factor P--(R)-beta-lysine ligase [Litorilituus sediminis]